MNIINGFVALAKLDNYISSFTLVRVHLDSLLRLYAFQLIDNNIDNIALQIADGKQMKDFKCKTSNRKLTDGYLVQKLSEIEGFEWVSTVYDTGNGFIHLSDKHMMTSMRKDFTKGVFSSVIGVGNNFIEIDDKIGACIYMMKITNGIYTFIENWITQKGSYNNANLNHGTTSGV